MRKITFCVITMFLSLTFVPTYTMAKADVVPTTVPVPTSAESPQAQLLLNRLNEINAMDKSNLNSSEKKALRKEVRSTKKQLAEISGGVYLSVGAIIIILLVLIILL